MIIGLHDAEYEHMPHKSFPNYALMKISAYHKSLGDTVEWWCALDNDKYDRIYSSKVFDFTEENPFLPPEKTVNGYCDDACFVDDGFVDNIGMEITEEFDEIDFDEQTETVINHVRKSKNWEIKSLFAMLMATVDGSNLVYNDWYGKYNPVPRLDFVYEVLCAFGYEMSDEEKQLQDGSHELFVKE